MVEWIIPRNTTTQMMAALAVSYASLLVVLTSIEYFENNSVTDMALSEITLNRINRVAPILLNMNDQESAEYLAGISHCHEGYSLTKEPYIGQEPLTFSQSITDRISDSLLMETSSLRVSFANMNRSDFHYNECDESDMKFPLEGMVLSVQISSNSWLNAEIHPHEWHLTPQMADWFIRSGTAFLIIGAISLMFVRRLHQPLVKLAGAAESFASNLKITQLEEEGPLDVKNTISAFNSMQTQVIEEVERRARTLAAISHDVRSPLTALRIKAELIDDENIRDDLISSISRMEKITTSALEYLKGESRNEVKRQIDLGALVESECVEYRDRGAKIDFSCPKNIRLYCRPQALARSISNLIDNAVKYAGSASITVFDTGKYVEISISDNGPGIPESKIGSALEPFGRLSEARESESGGFGLGLAIVDSVAKGHDGYFSLKQNFPTGLIASLHLPIA